MVSGWGRRQVLKGLGLGGVAAATGCAPSGEPAAEAGVTEAAQAGAEEVAPQGEVILGHVEDLHRVATQEGLVDLSDQRIYVVAWDPSLPGAREAYGGVGAVLAEDRGLLALSPACPHLGCRVPYCAPTRQFECPCHGGKFNSWGEWLGGPAPGGMDVLPSRIQGGRLVVDPRDRLRTPRRETKIGPEVSPEQGCLGL